MRTRGFTMMELAVCLAVSAVLVPLIFAFGRTFENQYHGAIIELESAKAMRSLSEEVRRDLVQARVTDDAGLVLAGKAECTRIEYVLEGSVIQRRADPACGGGTRAVARGARSLRRDGRTLLVEFGADLKPDLPVSISYRLALPEGGSR